MTLAQWKVEGVGNGWQLWLQAGEVLFTVNVLEVKFVSGCDFLGGPAHGRSSP